MILLCAQKSINFSEPFFEGLYSCDDLLLITMPDYINLVKRWENRREIFSLKGSRRSLDISPEIIYVCMEFMGGGSAWRKGIYLLVMRYLRTLIPLRKKASAYDYWRRGQCASPAHALTWPWLDSYPLMGLDKEIENIYQEVRSSCLFTLPSLPHPKGMRLGNWLAGWVVGPIRIIVSLPKSAGYKGRAGLFDQHYFLGKNRTWPLIAVSTR